MKEYYAIIIGTGSAMNFAGALKSRSEGKIAVIDKDEPGGICLTRGCIPSKLLIYPAELVRSIERAAQFGIEIEIKKIDFRWIMERMRTSISKEISQIQEELSNDLKIDYYREVAEFVAPYTIKVGNEIITSKMIFLCTGSKPAIPPIKGLNDAGYHTSDSVLKMIRLPESIAILGGGFIAAEYAHFFSAMGSRVTVIGRNPRILPAEEPEVSALAEREMSKRMDILTNHEAIEVQTNSDGKKKIIARNRSNDKIVEIAAEEILVATGRVPNNDILHPEKGGIKTDEKGWIAVNEYFETSQPNIWAFGDADGMYLFKHVANYESIVAYENAILKKRVKADYHAVPHAVFSHPEIASVGLKEEEAIDKYGRDNVLIGFARYEDTARGEAMEIKDCFVKVLVEDESNKILGAHIIGSNASILIQEIVNLMYTNDRSATPVRLGMHIHPSLSEVVDKAFGSLMQPAHYRHILKHLIDNDIRSDR